MLSGMKLIFIFIHFKYASYFLHKSIVLQRAMQHVLLNRFRINSNLFMTSLSCCSQYCYTPTPNNSYHTIYPIIIIKRLRKYFTFQFRNANTEFDTLSFHFISYNYHQNDSPPVSDVGNATRKKNYFDCVCLLVCFFDSFELKCF